MFSRRFNHSAVWCLFIVLGAYALYEIATEFMKAGVATGWALENAAMFPRLVVIFMIVFALTGLGFIVYDKIIIKTPVDTTDGDVIPFDKYCCMILVILLLYVLSLNTLGYYISSTVFLTVCLCILRQKQSITHLILSSLALSIAVVWFCGWIFEGVLGFVLPLGIWIITLS